MYWFWINMPLAAVFFGAWVGIPLWLVFKHPDRSTAPLAAQATATAGPPAPATRQTAAVPRPHEQLATV